MFSEYPHIGDIFVIWQSRDWENVAGSPSAAGFSRWGVGPISRPTSYPEPSLGFFAEYRQELTQGRAIETKGIKNRADASRQRVVGSEQPNRFCSRFPSLLH